MMYNFEVITLRRIRMVMQIFTEAQFWKSCILERFWLRASYSSSFELRWDFEVRTITNEKETKFLIQALNFKGSKLANHKYAFKTN